MANQVARIPAGTVIQVASIFRNVDVAAANEDMQAGVALSFPLLGIKGGKFHYKWKGEDQVIPDSTGKAARTLDVVIVQTQKVLSRTFYDPATQPFTDDAHNKPDCWSSDGVRPDSDVPKPVNDVCASCPNAQWASSKNPASPKAKACQERRRTIVVPDWGDGDLSNDRLGGPALLSVPPSALTNQNLYSRNLTELNAAYYMVMSQLSFNEDSTYPLLEFSYVRPLTEDEAKQIEKLRGDKQIENILRSKIKLDGPDAEVDDREPSRANGVDSTESAVKPTKAPPKPTTQAAPPPPPVAKAPSPPPPPPKVVAPAARAAAPVAKPPTIEAAIKTPAAPPPSARAVKAAPPPPPKVEPQGNGADTVDEAAMDNTLPDELMGELGGLINKP